MSYDTLFEAINCSGIGVFYKSTSGYYRAANESSARTLGTTRQAMIGRDDFTLFDPTSALLMRRRDYDITSKSTAKIYDSVVQINLVWKHFISAKAPLISAEGEVLGLIGLSTLYDRITNETSVGLIRDAFQLMRLSPIKFANSYLTWEVKRSDPNRVAHLVDLSHDEMTVDQVAH